MKEVLIKEYENTKILNLPYKEPKNTITYHFVDGATCSINGSQEKKYRVKFINPLKNETVHDTVISNNMWAKASTQYFIPWVIKVYDNETNELIESHTLDLKGKRVYVHLDSSALGDTLAWFPFVEEFRKKHQCHLITSTHRNHWFKEKYPEIEFATPGEVVYNLHAKYGVGWFYEGKNLEFFKHPVNPRTIPLQQTASSILGLPYKETKPLIDIPIKDPVIEGDYVCIAPHASAHAKYWNHPGGWQTIIDYLNEKGFKVVMITHEPLGDEWHDSKLGGTLKGVIDKTGNYPIEEIYNDIVHAKAFIGVSSGLSWLTWATSTPIVLISGFSKPFTEFQNCERIFNFDANVCNGCFNREWLDPGDWEWCPDHKDTSRHFECTKTIKPQTIINTLNKILNIY